MLQYPKDADGIWVPPDTTAMYRKNGNKFHVSDFVYEARADKRYARSGSNCVAVDNLYLEIEDEYRAIAMCADIFNRIRNLRGETHDC